MNTTALTSPKRSGWPYAIAGYFALAITGIAIFITWAVKQNMDLVRSDYYEQEILFQQHLDAVGRTRALGPSAALQFDSTRRALRIQVPAAHVAPSLAGMLHLYRPSDARLDRRSELAPGVTGEQWMSLADLAPGLWKARVEWAAKGERYVLEQQIFVE
jgi:nitrogen fixation protein FixH